MPTLHLTSEIEIQASVTRVWSVLANFDAYPQWNPFITSIQGIRAVGNRINVVIQPPGQKAMKFRPVILANKENRELRWLGRLVIPGLFDGEHRFVLEKLDDQSTRFIHSETFTGWLVPVFRKRLEHHTLTGFEMMNKALKQRAEASR